MEPNICPAVLRKTAEKKNKQLELTGVVYDA